MLRRAAGAVAALTGAAAGALLLAAHVDGGPTAPLWPARDAVVGAVLGASAAFMFRLNDTRVASPRDGEALEDLQRLIAVRPAGQGLLTISNHTSTLDDPALVALVAPAAVHWSAARMRWVLCAKELCFGNAFTSAFFTLGNVLPVARGEGSAQASLHAIGGVLAAGGWVHFFPEGRVNQTGALGPLRWGAARAYARAWRAAQRTGAPAPLVVAFYHTGMQRVKPVVREAPWYERVLPRTGQRVRVLVGAPQDLTPVMRRCPAELQAEAEEDDECARALMQAMQHALIELEARAADASPADAIHATV